MDYQTMGDLITELRKQQNMTQKDLADKLNVTDKAVSKWERGVSCPDIHTIPRLAKILNTSSEELLNIQTNIPTVRNDGIGKKANQIITLILKAVALAMGVAVLVLSVLGEIQINSAITMLAIGIICIAVAQFQSE